jgi:hypothetical protein
MSVFMLKNRLQRVQQELANATDQKIRNSLALRVEQLKVAIFDAESAEWHGHGWRSRERNA